VREVLRGYLGQLPRDFLVVHRIDVVPFDVDVSDSRDVGGFDLTVGVHVAVMLAREVLAIDAGKMRRRENRAPFLVTKYVYGG